MGSLLKNIGITERYCLQYRNDKLKELGINGCQHMYILNICSKPGMPQENLAKLNCINKSNVTRTLAQLEEDGFILRKNSEEDKRVILIYPTQKAIDIYPKVKKVLIEWEDYVMTDFTEEEKIVISNLMEKVKHKAKELTANDICLKEN
ncbi:MAG: hypothetical protein K0R15_2108 [Clostridiales bacterium]|jgi:DNA-binding MarR family transcriptional regulator|nr:hypothetical protein [Clostridiales bacterium]